MKIVSIIFLAFLSIALHAQEPAYIKNRQTLPIDNADSYLDSLNKQNDFIVAFRIKYQQEAEQGSEPFVFARKDKNLTAYRYSEKTETLVSLNIPADELQLVWDTFIQNELFSLSDEKDISSFCAGKYQIYNSYSYEFVTYNKGEIKRLSYYDPEYYESVCFGMDERSKIINSAAVIARVLRL